jgi:hypothetical protein
VTAGPAGWLPAAIAILTILATGAACETRASGKVLAEKLRPSILEKLGEISVLECPERVTIQNDVTTFPCHLELADGKSGTINVTLDREGSLAWKGE